MGIFDIERIKKLVSNYNEKFKIIVETGTLFGNTTLLLTNFFDEVYTIELQEDLYKIADIKFKNNKKIKCFQGDSPDILNKLSFEIKDNLIFFLDAHWSGDNNNVDWKNSLWKGYGINTAYRNNNHLLSTNQNPLEEELNIIMNNYKQELIIYIDDIDKFDNKTGIAIKDCCFKGENWEHLSIEKIINIVKPRLLDIKFFNDQILIHIKNIN